MDVADRKVGEESLEQLDGVPILAFSRQSGICIWVVARENACEGVVAREDAELLDIHLLFRIIATIGKDRYQTESTRPHAILNGAFREEATPSEVDAEHAPCGSEHRMESHNRHRVLPTCNERVVHDIGLLNE